MRTQKADCVRRKETDGIYPSPASVLSIPIYFQILNKLLQEKRWGVEQDRRNRREDKFHEERRTVQAKQTIAQAPTRANIEDAGLDFAHCLSHASIIKRGTHVSRYDG